MWNGGHTTIHNLLIVMTGYNLCMARGWESKSVEAQQADAANEGVKGPG
jgi:hypothetical protein